MNGPTESRKNVITPPPGWKPPENAKPDAEWDMVCSFKTMPDGKIELCKLGDTPMRDENKEKNEKNEKQEMPSWKEQASGMAGAVQSMSGGYG